jgi:hypothetical protein
MNPGRDTQDSLQHFHVARPPHVDYGRLVDVIDGLEALTETESSHLTRCPDCLASAREAAKEVIRSRRAGRSVATASFYHN